jgi:predicted enzyme related to lactoylglutathione lyase
MPDILARRHRAAPPEQPAADPVQPGRRDNLWQARPVATFQRIAPIFPVHDLDRATAHYQRLGFTIRRYAGGGYAYATHGDIELHLGALPEDDNRTTSAYLFVDDADALAAQWSAGGVDLHPPQDTQWGRREGAVVDPDGNVIRFGSAIPVDPAVRADSALANSADA